MRGNPRQLNMRGNPAVLARNAFCCFAATPPIFLSAGEAEQANTKLEKMNENGNSKCVEKWAGGSTHDSKVMVFYFLLSVILHSSSDSVRVWKVSMNKFNLKCNINSKT